MVRNFLAKPTQSQSHSFSVESPSLLRQSKSASKQNKYRRLNSLADSPANENHSSRSVRSTMLWYASAEISWAGWSVKPFGEELMILARNHLFCLSIGDRLAALCCNCFQLFDD